MPRLTAIPASLATKVEVDFRKLMMKRLVHTGSTLRPRSIAEKSAIARDLKKHVWPLIESGKVKPLIDHVFTLNEASTAHALMEKSTHIGKIMLTV